MNTKRIVVVALGVIALIATFIIVPKLWEDVDAGEIVIIQDPVDGNLHVYSQPGWQWQGMGRVTHYRKSNQFWFLAKEKPDRDEVDNSIGVKWNDGGHCNISGSVRYDLPMDEAQLIRLHSIFGSQQALENQLIKTNVEKSIFMTGPLMSSKESYAEKRNDLIFYIEDQASRGVYKTRQVDVKEIDPLSKAEKTVTKVEIILDSKSMPLRQEVSPIAVNGIKLYNISIKRMDYDKNVERQIQTQQQATMQIQTAIAEAKRAEQRALTVEKEGEANAAQAKWDQEVIKAKEVTQAEARKTVAELDVQTADLNKRKAILEGEGEAAKKRLVMQANGALEQKLEAWLRSQEYWAKAFSEYGGNVVPQIITGGGSGNSNNGAISMMEIMGAKAARDLSLDLSNKK